MAVHNCGFSGQISHTELITLSVASIDDDNTDQMSSPSMNKDWKTFKNGWQVPIKSTDQFESYAIVERISY